MAGQTVKKLVLPLAISAFFLLSGVSPVFAANSNSNRASSSINPLVPCGSVQVVTAPGVFGDNAEYDCTYSFSGLPLHSWGDTFFAVTNNNGFNEQIKVTVTDCCLVGDYFALWAYDGIAGTWHSLGSTPKVHTGPSLVAPTFNSLWDGSGTTSSTKTFKVTIPAGDTVYLRVNDGLLSLMTKKLDKPCGVTADTLLSAGCSVTGISVGPGWTPAGYSITFDNAV